MILELKFVVAHIMFRTVLGTNQERCNVIFAQKWILSCFLCTDIVDVFTIQHIQRLFGDMYFTLSIKEFASSRCYNNTTKIKSILPRKASRFQFVCNLCIF